VQDDIRTRLRAETAAEHRRTEAGFAAVCAALSDAHCYGAFLLAHARAFPAIGRALSAGLGWPAWPARWRALESDLAALALGAPPALTVAPAASRAAALGMAYVLEGSRLGAALLLARVPAGFPAAYLAGGQDRAPWRRLLGLLETIDTDEAAAAVAGAKTAFRAFRAAAAPQPAPRMLEPAS
jgi:heme oxygenase